MLKIRVSALKSEGWNFTKFGKVKKNTLYVSLLFFVATFFLYFYKTDLKIMKSGACYICPTLSMWMRTRELQRSM